MKLRYPAALCVFFSDKKKERCLKLQLLGGRRREAVKTFCENLLDFFCGCRTLHDIGESVVGNTASEGGEEIHTDGKCPAQVGKGADRNTGDLG